MTKTYTYANGTVEKTITRDEMIDVITAALEDGIGYWACLDNTRPEWVEARKRCVQRNDGKPALIEEIFLEVLDAGETVYLEDEEDENETYAFTLKNLLDGCQRWENFTSKIKDLKTELEDGAVDAEDGDIIFQLGLFDEIVFG